MSPYRTPPEKPAPLRVPLHLRLLAFVAFRKGGTWVLEEDGEFRYALPPDPPPRVEPQRNPRGNDPHHPRHHAALMKAWAEMQDRAKHTRRRAALLRGTG